MQHIDGFHTQSHAHTNLLVQMLDAINAYEGRQLYNLVPLVREVYGEDNNTVKDSYYAIAVCSCFVTHHGCFTTPWLFHYPLLLQLHA